MLCLNLLAAFWCVASIAESMNKQNHRSAFDAGDEIKLATAAAVKAAETKIAPPAVRR